ncbi:prepilin peptidase [Aliivibrio fischeri]|uniref:Type IV leader peptidase n=1 Tax=Aliivibrio fischeri TaxID=668 RepID=A0A844NXG2_ALIFS|nr:prepilin peptidase [Aliivibrio fischeri]MCE7537056.1 prepilin peptidase [Aliivibrio fischeri]MCE7559818.1 prepilin peptidase [Aliivibrio fischeri]MUK47747.1 type IV leader peptidase [Aliivibrio fischeri]MUK94207.1 type IV leader peptidase [Aliivibrio fischeri]
MEIKLLIISVVTIANIYAVFHDIKNRKISNNVVLIIMFVGFFSIFVKGDISYLLSPLIILFVGFILFKFNIIAAGDIKYYAAMSLMIEQQYLLLVTCIILCLGGLQAYCQYSIYKLTGNERWIERGVPYGVAISIGSLFGILASI